jgi:tungstate transport system substrate-binding protein
VQDGFGSVRREVMYNELVLVGPDDDPAKINGTHNAIVALHKIAEAKAPFVSRGDKSGTDAAEGGLWVEIGGRPRTAVGVRVVAVVIVEMVERIVVRSCSSGAARD